MNVIDARLTAGWHSHSGQRKRYLKSLNQKKKVGFLLGIFNIVIPATRPSTNLAKTFAKSSYTLLAYPYGMQVVSGSSSLGSLNFSCDSIKLGDYTKSSN